MNTQITPVSNRPAFSVPSILAVICAVASFYAGAAMGMFLAIAAIVLGATGMLMSVAPSIRGGITSFIAMGAGLIGIIAAIIKIF